MEAEQIVKKIDKWLMKQCKNVENLELAFSSITVKTTFEEPLSPYTFAYCELVRNINSIFGDCIINGYLDDNRFILLDYTWDKELRQFKKVVQDNNEINWE